MAGLTLTGAYLLSGHDGPYAVERFTCSTTVDGWRYDAVREDPATSAALGRLELHLRGDVTLLHAEAGGWVLRGAAADGEVLWRRGEQERQVAGDGFTGTSPAFLVACARRERARLRLLEVTEPVLATRTAEQSWRPLGASGHDGVEVASYEVDDLATGERRTVRLTDDVVVEAPGVQLTALTRA